MTRFANRTALIDSFKVMEIVERAAKLERAGAPVIHLSIGEPDFGAPEQVINRLMTSLSTTPMRYTSALGIWPLREAIANYYADRFTVHIDPKRVIITAGASAGLTLACAALVNPGDEVIMADPSYPCNRNFVRAAGGIPKLLPCGPEQRFQLNAAQISSAWRPQTAGLLIASPANPTGTSLLSDELESCLKVAEERAGFSIVDEIYLELTYPTNGLSQAGTALALSDQVFVTNSFSKFFNMTGWRLGWLVVPDEAVPVLERLSQNLYICPSTLAQHAALECFTPEMLTIFEARKEQFRLRRDYLVPALVDAGLQVPVIPDGAFYVYADVSKTGLSATQFASELLNQQHVAIVPGEDFGEVDSQRYVRISYANHMDNLKEAVGRIKSFINNRSAIS